MNVKSPVDSRMVQIIKNLPLIRVELIRNENSRQKFDISNKFTTDQIPQNKQIQSNKNPV